MATLVTVEVDAPAGDSPRVWTVPAVVLGLLVALGMFGTGLPPEGLIPGWATAVVFVAFTVVVLRNCFRVGQEVGSAATRRWPAALSVTWLATLTLLWMPTGWQLLWALWLVAGAGVAVTAWLHRRWQPVDGLAVVVLLAVLLAVSFPLRHRLEVDGLHLRLHLMASRYLDQVDDALAGEQEEGRLVGAVEGEKPPVVVGWRWNPGVLRSSGVAYDPEGVLLDGGPSVTLTPGAGYRCVWLRGDWDLCTFG